MNLIKTLRDLIEFLEEMGEDIDSPIEFYKQESTHTVRMKLQDIASDETGTVGIYLKEVK